MGYCAEGEGFWEATAKWALGIALWPVCVAVAFILDPRGTIAMLRAGRKV